MKKALAMKCTQKQWDSIKDRIPKEMINDNQFNLIDYPYLTNNYNSQNRIGIGTHSHDFIKSNVKIHEKFNAKIFLDACGIETDVYEITKEQVLELHNIGYTGKEALLEKWFPNCFKKELEVGRWYRAIYTNINYLFFVNKINDGYYEGFGFSNNVNWSDGLSFRITYDYKFSEATHQEVEAALIMECEKIGLVDGAHYTSPNGRFKRVVKYPLKLDKGVLIDAENHYIFDCGVFANPVQPEKMTLEQIEKELGRKIQIV